MTRDEEGLKRAFAQGAQYVWVRLETGQILWRSKFREVLHLKGEKPKGDRMTVAEYVWLTDPDRKTEVVTAADLYDTIEWTPRGFVIGGKKISISQKKR